MKKITILFIVFFIANTMTLKAQVAISKNAVFLKSSEFENKRFDDFKKTTTIFVLNNLYEKKQYEEMLKSSWTITPFEVVDLKDFKYENYLSDKYSFCMMYGNTMHFSDGNEKTKFLIHFYILDMDLVNKKKSKLIDNPKATKLNSKATFEASLSPETSVATAPIKSSINNVVTSII